MILTFCKAKELFIRKCCLYLTVLLKQQVKMNLYPETAPLQCDN